MIASKRLTPVEVARLLGVSGKRVRAWVSNGELPAINLGPGGNRRSRFIIELDALEEFVKRRRTDANSAA